MIHLHMNIPCQRQSKEGYLSPIKAVTIPLKLDLSGVATQAGDFKASDIDTALGPLFISNSKRNEKLL